MTTQTTGTSVTSHRRLAAVMFTDIVGYSSLAERDEALAIELVGEHQKILRQIFPSFGGQEIKSTGDGFFCEFSSVVDAVQCAISIQTALFERNLSSSEDRKLQIRIGLHLGDVVDSEKDRFGTEVNIAARIEPFAQPGGICITQQVMDHVGSKIEFPTRKLGKLLLKNIKKPLALYRIVLPWETGDSISWHAVFRKLTQSFPKTPEGGLLAVQLAGVIGVLGFIFVKLWFPVTLTVDRGPSRSIASVAAVAAAPVPTREILLPETWQYAHEADAEAGTRWAPFDVHSTYSYADELSGDYLLKLDFVGAGGFRHPAMSIGLISDVHRVYLNGKFVGGSERFADSAVYSFDPGLIKPGEKNTILIKARTRSSFSPGLSLLPGMAPKIGEFEEVLRDVSARQFSFQVLRPIGLAISLLLAIASLCYCVFRRGQLKYFYYSSFLFLGALCLTYYNTFVTACLSYPFYRFTKLLALGLSSSVLFSSYLNTRGKKRLEVTNNFLSLAATAVAALVLFSGELRPSQYLARYHAILWAAFAYTCAWLALLGARGIYKLSKPVELRSISSSQIAHVALVSGFGAVIGFLCLISVVEIDRFKDLALMYPFAFAMVVLGIGVSDYSRKSRDLGHKHRKDDLILSIAHVIATDTDVSKTIAEIQNRVTGFLKARRSTIYLCDDGNGTESLKAGSIHGPVGTTGRVKRLIENPSGIIGYCVQHRSPIFVENIEKDPRFRAMSQAQDDAFPGFKNGSFMVFPLILGSRLLGVITVADRLDGQSFSREDFCLMHLVAKDLALLLNQPQLQEKLRDQAA